MHGRMIEMVIGHSSVDLDVNIKNLNGVTPLHVAALNNTEACSMLLNYKADVNSITNLDIHHCNMQLSMVATRLAGY